MENWKRKEFYNHYINEVRCSYSTTINIDIANLKGQKLYPAMIWLLTETVNKMSEFRTALTDEGLGLYDKLNPAYTIFNKENKNFSVIWTEFNCDYYEFLKSYEADKAKFSSSIKLTPMTDKPMNTFDISMVPWFTFSSFIAIHKNILTLDNGGKIEIGDDENAKYRSTRIDGKGIWQPLKTH